MSTETKSFIEELTIAQAKYNLEKLRDFIDEKLSEIETAANVGWKDDDKFLDWLASEGDDGFIADLAKKGACLP